MGSKDNFIVNAPFIYFLDRFLGISRSTLFIESLIFDFINFTLFLFSGIYILKKCRITLNFNTLLPFIWIASFGIYFTYLLLNPNWRIPEIGFMFVLYALGLKLYYGEIDPLKTKLSILLSLVTIAILGLFVYSDSYFLYFGIVPILFTYLVLLILKRIDKRIVYLTLVATLLSVLVSQILRSTIARIGLFTPGSLLTVPKLLSLKNITTNLYYAFKSYAYIFGALRNLQYPSSIWSNVSLFLNGSLITILPFVLIYVYLIKGHRYKSIFKNKILKPKTLIVIILSIVMIFDFVSYALVDGGNTVSYRYLIVLVFAYIVLISIGVANLKKAKIIFIPIILAAIIVNLINTYNYVNLTTSLNSAPPNSSSIHLITVLDKLKLYKGFGNYWNGDINTYLSDGKINFIPIACVNGISKPDYLLFNSAELNKHTLRSFYLIEPNITSPVSCSFRQVVNQFGKPTKVIKYKDKTLLIYNYDLTKKLK